MAAGGSIKARKNGARVAYFVIAFGVPWVTIGAIMVLFGVHASDETLGTLYPIIFLAMLAGPVLGSIGVTAVTEGGDGVRTLLGRVFHWRGPARYYLGVLVVPATLLVVLLVASSFGERFLPAALAKPDLATIGMGLGIGLVAGFFEEIGWTGYATPRDLPPGAVLRAAVPLGLIHGLWHLPADYWSESTRYGWLFLPFFVLFWMVGLLALRMLIVWLYARTQSVPIAQLTHASYTGSLFALWPATVSPIDDMWWTAAFAIVLLAVVVGLATMAAPGAGALAKRPSVRRG